MDPTNPPPPEAPGARQALATGASTLLVVTVAFAAWWTFATDADAGLVLGFGLAAVIALAAVPLLATHPSGSLRRARWAYAIGALCAVAALLAGFLQAFGDDEEGGGDSGPDQVSVQADLPQLPARPRA